MIKAIYRHNDAQVLAKRQSSKKNPVTLNVWSSVDALMTSNISSNLKVISLKKTAF